MRKRELERRDAVGEQITEKRRDEDDDLAVQRGLREALVQAKGDKRAGDGHREAVGAERGEAAVREQDSLEDKDDESEDARSRGAEEHGAQAGARHVRAGTGDAGNLERGDNEHERAGKRKQRERAAVLGKCLLDRLEANHHERQANDAPRDAVLNRQEALHNVHGIGSRHDAKESRDVHARSQ